MFGLISNQKGFAALFITILILVIVFGVALSIAILTFGEQRILGNVIKSSQAYYVAEAGIEDALLRLNKGMNFSSPYNLIVGQGTATIEISDSIGGSRTIISQGDMLNRIRKVRAIRAMTTEKISFYYGAQVGDGGMSMGNNSEIQGSVFSNSSVRGAGHITGTVKVAGSGNRIQDLFIDEDAYAHNCRDCTIAGTLYYWTGGSINNCKAGIRSKAVLPESLPVSQENITNWQDEASCNNNPSCIYSGDYIVPQNTTVYLGPQKIEGDLIIENNAVLVVTGIIWVAGDGLTTDGDVLPDNDTEIKLDLSYGFTSGVILADGKIRVENNVKLSGSGIVGSYIMLLSTDPSVDPDDPAIDVLNNAEGAILYASVGMLRLHNNIKIREGTAYQISLDNDAVIRYQSGLENTSFSSGPGGSWRILEWREIE